MPTGTERPESAFVKDALSGTRFEDVLWIDETGSTNDDLVAAAMSGAGERVLITDLQTAGRGRRNRVWDAPAGSGILMSTLLRGRSPQDGFWSVGAIALAASQAIDALVAAPSTLKWPNDVMLGAEPVQKKVAGVLASVVGDAVVVGIGINVNWPPEVPAELRARGTAINYHQADEAPLDRAPIAVSILERAIGHLERDPAVLRRAWSQQCSTLGRPVRLELETGEIVGNAAGVAADGALIVDREGVRTTHQVGDVVHLRPDA